MNLLETALAKNGSTVKNKLLNSIKTFHHSRATKFQKLQLQDFSTFVILDWINASVQWSQIDFILENNSATTEYF